MPGWDGSSAGSPPKQLVASSHNILRPFEIFASTILPSRKKFLVGEDYPVAFIQQCEQVLIQRSIYLATLDEPTRGGSEALTFAL